MGRLEVERVAGTRAELAMFEADDTVDEAFGKEDEEEEVSGTAG